MTQIEDQSRNWSPPNHHAQPTAKEHTERVLYRRLLLMEHAAELDTHGPQSQLTKVSSDLYMHAMACACTHMCTLHACYDMCLHMYALYMHVMACACNICLPLSCLEISGTERTVDFSTTFCLYDSSGHFSPPFMNSGLSPFALLCVLSHVADTVHDSEHHSLLLLVFIQVTIA